MTNFAPPDRKYDCSEGQIRPIRSAPHLSLSLNGTTGRRHRLHSVQAPWDGFHDTVSILREPRLIRPKPACPKPACPEPVHHPKHHHGRIASVGLPQSDCLGRAALVGSSWSDCDAVLKPDATAAGSPTVNAAEMQLSGGPSHHIGDRRPRAPGSSAHLGAS